MRILIVEDDFTGRKILQNHLSKYGECDIAVDGNEAVEAYKISLDDRKHYDLICMDIMMPNMDGREALKNIRDIEDKRGMTHDEKVKVVMTTALNDPKSIIGSFKDQCEGYLVKPINKTALLEKLKELKLM